MWLMWHSVSNIYHVDGLSDMCSYPVNIKWLVLGTASVGFDQPIGFRHKQSLP